MLIRKRTSILEKNCCNYEQLFHPVQCTAWITCQCNSIQIFVSLRVPGILSFSDQVLYLWDLPFFRNVTWQNSNCLYQSWRLNTLFSYQCKLSILKKSISMESVFAKSGVCLSSTTASVSCLSEVFGIVSTVWKSLKFDLSQDIGFCYLQCSTSA